MRAWIAAPRGGGATRRAGSGSPAADAHHPLDEVDAGHLLGDAVLDLEARVDLEEVELAACRASKTNSTVPARAVARPRAPSRTAASQQRRARSSRQAGRRRLLDDLLVAPLQRAVALAERDAPCPRRRRRSAPRCGARASTNFSRKTPPSLKLLRARRATALERLARARRRRAQRRMPMPPPPAVLFSITG